jgi:hypothetical protein
VNAIVSKIIVLLGVFDDNGSMINTDTAAKVTTLDHPCSKQAMRLCQTQ